MNIRRDDQIGVGSESAVDGYTGFFICFFDKSVNPHGIDFARLEEGYDLIGEIEKVFLSGNPYYTDNNDYYFFQDAWPLTTHFIAPVSFRELLNDPYFNCKFQLIETSNINFDAEEGALDQPGFKKVFIEKESGFAQPEDTRGRARHRNLQNVVDIFEECGRRAAEKNGFLIANINQSKRASYLRAMEIQQTLSSLFSLQDGESPLKNLAKYGYVFTEYYLRNV